MLDLSTWNQVWTWGALPPSAAQVRLGLVIMLVTSLLCSASPCVVLLPGTCGPNTPAFLCFHSTSSQLKKWEDLPKSGQQTAYLSPQDLAQPASPPPGSSSGLHGINQLSNERWNEVVLSSHKDAGTISLCQNPTSLSASFLIKRASPTAPVELISLYHPSPLLNIKSPWQCCWESAL